MSLQVIKNARIENLASELARLSTFASKTPAVAGVLLVGLHYTAFRDAIREDSRQTTPSRGVTQRKKFAVEANVESRAKRSRDIPRRKSTRMSRRPL